MKGSGFIMLSMIGFLSAMAGMMGYFTQGFNSANATSANASLRGLSTMAGVMEGSYQNITSACTSIMKSYGINGTSLNAMEGMMQNDVEGMMDGHYQNQNGYTGMMGGLNR